MAAMVRELRESPHTAQEKPKRVEPQPDASGTQEGQQTPGGVGCSRADEKEANIDYLSDEEQRQRVIEVVLREKGEDCPELVVVGARARLGGGLVDYLCKEGDPSDSLMLTPEDARYVGIDMSVPDPPETGG